MRVSPALPLAALLLVCVGCHHDAPAAPSTTPLPAAHVSDQMQQQYATAQAEDSVQRSLAPSELVALHQEKGVGVALQITGRRFPAGHDIPILIAYQDLAATQPISSTNCNGFTIVVEDIDRGRNLMATLSPCSTGNPFAQANVPLVKGNLRFLHSSLAAGRIALTQPGRYLVNASWQSYRPTNGPFGKDASYATVRSNIIPLTVAP